MNCNSSMNYSANYLQNNGVAQDGAYISSGEWSQPIQVDPTNPSSPVSVQPNGPGTQLDNGYNVSTVDPGFNRPVNPIDPNFNVPVSQLPETLTKNIYTPGYLNDHIGALVRVEFLIANNLNDRVGVLKEVGASYIVLESLDQGSVIMCDLYSIKFCTILQSNTDRRLLGAF